jgi:hypothetical protein
MKRRLVIAVLGAMLAAAPAAAQVPNWGGDRSEFWRDQDPRSQWAPQEDRGGEVPLGAVLRDLRSQFSGRHLDAQRAGDRYVIAWMTDDGRRLTIEVDARSGRTISVR